MVSSTFLALSAMVAVASVSSSPAPVYDQEGNMTFKMKKRGDAPCATKFDFVNLYTGPNGAVPSIGYNVQMTSDGEDFVSESSSCYLGKWGSGCKWTNPGTATIKDGGDHYDFTHSDYGFLTLTDLTGKTITWTVEGCPDYTCTLQTAESTVFPPDFQSPAYPLTITACRDGTRSPNMFTDEQAGNMAWYAASKCTSDTDPDCNDVQQNTNIGR